MKRPASSMSSSQQEEEKVVTCTMSFAVHGFSMDEIETSNYVRWPDYKVDRNGQPLKDCPKGKLCYVFSSCGFDARPDPPHSRANFAESKSLV